MIPNTIWKDRMLKRCCPITGGELSGWGNATRNGFSISTIALTITAKARDRLTCIFLENLFCYQVEISVGEGNGTPLQYSCLQNPRDGGAWWAAIYGVTQGRTPLK